MNTNIRESSDAKMRFCVIGSPVAHSLSPFIHGCWYAHYGMNAAYEAIEVGGAGGLSMEDFFFRLSSGYFSGCNVTIPHKRAVMAFLDHREDAARVIGAVNTIFFRDGKFHGDNTDGRGFLLSLSAALGGDGSLADLAGKTCVILGAGGASRAIGWAVSKCDFGKVVVVNRSVLRGEELASLIAMWNPTIHASYTSWDHRHDSLACCDMVINATSLGMAGQDPLDISLSAVSSDCIVVESVYRPLMTPLLVSARARGLRIIDGLGMLLHQAALSFEIWLGVRPSVDFAYRRLRHDGLIG